MRIRSRTPSLNALAAAATVGMALLVGAGCTKDTPPEPTATVQEETRKPRAELAWTPTELKVSATPGSTQELNVSFKALENVSATSVRVSSSLVPFVTVIPRHFPARRKGSTQSFTVKVTVPEGAQPQTVTGTLALHHGHGHGKGQPALSPTLPIQITVKETIAQTIERLEATGTIPVLDRGDDLAGPDANANGIRDDIDAYVAKQGYTEPESASVNQLAQVFQAAVVLGIGTIDDDAARQLDERMNRAVHCLGDRFPNDRSERDPHALLATYRKLTANTEPRLRAYLSYNAALGGTVSTLPQGDTCD